MADITIAVDNSDRVLNELERNVQAALEACGQQAVKHAKDNITSGIPRNSNSWYTPTGALRNSVNHIVQADVCYVGTNQDYAIYNEYGTGKYVEGGRGRKGWWVFVVNGDGSKRSKSGKSYTKEEAAKIVAILRSKGLDAHMTEGMKPLHFLKNAIANNVNEYKSIIEEYLKR